MTVFIANEYVFHVIRYLVVTLDPNANFETGSVKSVATQAEELKQQRGGEEAYNVARWVAPFEEERGPSTN
ncbi:unnamed protein product [Soboliphyme baturini]|uniref:Cysteine proteinase inhibitor n=1 Tax=Soboliphyme baturini TaxID=241478 RepID=A0A183J0E8_9BILA|nr:unnamed protein product [Soboliphyme baturini]